MRGPGGTTRGEPEPPAIRGGPNLSFWDPKAGGIEALPKGLMAALDPERVQLDTEVTAIDPVRQTVTTSTGDAIGYGDLISSLPLPVLVGLAANSPDHVRAAAAQLKWNTVPPVMVGVRREGIPDHHWDYFR